MCTSVWPLPLPVLVNCVWTAAHSWAGAGRGQDNHTCMHAYKQNTNCHPVVARLVKTMATHPKTARAKAVARNGSSGAAVMKAQAMAVTEQPAAVIFVIIASPLETFSTVWPSVICTPPW